MTNFAKNNQNTLYMNIIKNLLFDLGGVIIDINRDRCVKALTALGMEGAEEMLGLYVQSGEFMQLEDGKLSPEQFRDAIRNRIKTNRTISDEEIDSALNQFLLGIPAHRLKSLRELRQKYRIYLLSNTNPIMFYSKIAESFRAEGFEMCDYFDGQVASFIAKCSKPGREIFEYAIKNLEIAPCETLFLDDSQKNLDTAQILGFKTALVAPGTEFADILKTKGLF